MHTRLSAVGFTVRGRSGAVLQLPKQDIVSADGLRLPRGLVVGDVLTFTGWVPGK